jgi:hypothetical protein
VSFEQSNVGLLTAHRSLLSASSYTSRIEALIKIYSLVDCPIYSVIKHRPRQRKLAFRLSGSGLLTARSSSLLAASNPMFGTNHLMPNIRLESRLPHASRKITAFVTPEFLAR